MKLKNKYLVALAPITAIATTMPMTLTSCGSNTGANANLAKDYTCEFKPEAKTTYDNASEALDNYLEKVSPSNSNTEDYAILKDDARFAYSKAFQTENFKKVGTLTDYTLNFEDVVLDKVNKTMDVTFVIKAKGSYKDSFIGFTNGDFSAKLKMSSPFKIEFCKADDSTLVKMNYIKCSLDSLNCKYQLTGSCTLTGGTPYTANVTSWTNFNAWTAQADLNGWVTFNLVINGLMCNVKNLTQETNYGVLYTNYMSLAEINK